MPYLVEKQGFEDSAAIFDTHDKAVNDGTKYWPEIPFTVSEISQQEANERWERYKIRVSKNVPSSMIPNTWQSK